MVLVLWTSHLDLTCSTISLDLTKSSEVRKAGDRPNSKGSGYIHLREAHKNQGKYISYIGIYLHIHLVLTQILNMLVPRIIRYFRCNIFFWQLFSKFTLSCGFILHYTHFEDKSPKWTKEWFPNSCGGSRYLRQAFTSPPHLWKY